MTNNILNKFKWLILATLLIAAVILVWLAPDEKTLGPGIKVVYVHVALMWAGMLGLGIAGALGLGIAVTANKKLLGLTEKIAWVGLGMFVGGVLMSMVAAKINWGAVFLQEPRMAAGINFSAVALIVLTVGSWLPDIRLRGTLYPILVVAMLWSTWRSPLVLHPDDPIGTSTSFGIRFSFFALFCIAFLLGTWIVWVWQQHNKQ